MSFACTQQDVKEKFFNLHVVEYMKETNDTC